ncbi:hypothetical protein J437_LFUL003699 [Ladona fulva]|uniref:Uncharacterized protein n=1 Tax=Ladona fulva TaxID=123851 RepID=A0A8K0K0Q9_LADFU|nr:hypothetical protein J437_LFUL003699 [Ladona fulva]
MQSASVIKFISGPSNITAFNFVGSNVIAKRGKPFSDGEYMKEKWLKSAPVLFEDLENKEKNTQRIKDFPLARNTVNCSVLDMAKNITYQQKTDINSSDFVSLWITGSARLAIFVRY